MVSDSKKCKNCSELILEKRKIFCNSSCAATFNNKLRKTDFGCCLECEKELNKSKRKYCSNKCQGLFESKKTFKNIENGNIDYHEETFKRFLIFKYGAQCMNCGWNQVNQYTGKVPIQIEHIDGNAENNELKNLKLLCPNCHSLTKTWGGANKGNGRKKRREKKQMSR